MIAYCADALVVAHHELGTLYFRAAAGPSQCTRPTYYANICVVAKVLRRYKAGNQGTISRNRNFPAFDILISGRMNILDTI